MSNVIICLIHRSGQLFEQMNLIKAAILLSNVLVPSQAKRGQNREMGKPTAKVCFKIERLKESASSNTPSWQYNLCKELSGIKVVYYTYKDP
jgi:hypothetical protein